MKSCHGITDRPRSVRVTRTDSPPIIPHIATPSISPPDVDILDESPETALSDTANSPNVSNDSPVSADTIHDDGSPEPTQADEPNLALEEPLAEFVPQLRAIARGDLDDHWNQFNVLLDELSTHIRLLRFLRPHRIQ